MTNTSVESVESVEPYELQAIHAGEKSFYKKAHVKTVESNNGIKKVLQSYTTDVAAIENGKAIVYGTYSRTTMRHINEFLEQEGFQGHEKNEILEVYGEMKESK